MFPRGLDAHYVGRVLTIGAAVATVFGTFWVVSGLQAAHVPAFLTVPFFAAAVCVAARMILACIRLVISAGLFPVTGDQQAIKQAGSYINVATVIQITASIVAPLLLARWGHADMGFAAVIITVGLYLLAFAPLLRMPHYYLVGVLLTLIPVVSLLVLPETIVVAAGHIQAWTALPGVACGLLYLALGGTNLLLAVRIRRGQYQHTRAQQTIALQHLPEARVPGSV